MAALPIEDLTPSGWSQERDIPVIKNSLRTLRVWRTRKLETLQALLTQHAEVKSPFIAKEAHHAWNSFLHKQLLIESGYIHLCETDPESA